MRRLVAMALSIWLAGCVGLSNTGFSKAQIEGATLRAEKYVGDMFVLSKVDLRVYPMNAKSETPMIFPPPIYDAQRTDPAQTFSVGVSIIAKHPGQTLLPQQFAYISPGGRRFTPIEMVGPFSCRSSTAPPATTHLPIPPFLLEEGQCYSMWLLFDAPAPDPNRTFYFEAGALQVDGRTRSLPIIRFTEASRASSVAVP